MGWGFCHLRSRSRGSGSGIEAKSHGLGPLLLLGLAWMGAACAGYGTGGAGLEFSADRPKTEFSGVRVLQNERRLASDPADDTEEDCPSASERLIRSLKAMGASIEEAPPDPKEGVAVGLGDPEAATVALLKGASSDPILLIAPYTETCSGRDPGSSQFGSAAFLLELGRVLSTHPIRYSIWLIFVPESTDEGGGPRQSGSLEPAPWPALTRVVSHFEQSGVLERVRVAIFFEGLGLPNSSAHRDSHSHPIYREVFWESARDLGLTDLFPEDAVFASSPVGHQVLINEGLRRTVLVSTTAGSKTAEGSSRGGSGAEVQAFQSVGDVSLEAIGRIQTRLERIDRLSARSEQG